MKQKTVTATAIVLTIVISTVVCILGEQRWTVQEYGAETAKDAVIM